MMEAKVGDKGYFGRKNGEKTYGEVVKVNRKTLKVKQLEDRGTQKSHNVGTVWTVPKTLWTPENEGRPAYATKPRRPRRKRPCLVNVLTGERTYGEPGMSEDLLFGLMANGMLPKGRR
ncbi:MAG: hypothetical protein GWN58_33045 [Anaerolineae bacterium]|nr:hypothetical protein [Anaerolineae bacterium]